MRVFLGRWSSLMDSLTVVRSIEVKRGEKNQIKVQTRSTWLHALQPFHQLDISENKREKKVFSSPLPSRAQ